MKLDAGLDPILALLVAVGWFVVKALLNRKQDSDSWEEWEQTTGQHPHAPDRAQGAPSRKIEKTGPPALPPTLIRRQDRPAPTSPAPPVIRKIEKARPIIVAEPEGPMRGELAHLKQSEESYSRATQLQQAVANRFSTIDQQTVTHKPTQPRKHSRSTVPSDIARVFRNPLTARQAFLASFVLNPPKALE